MLVSSRDHALRIAFSVMITIAVWTCASAAQIATPPAEQEPSPEARNQIDNYMTNHPGVAAELHRDPSLVNNPTWLAQHPQLQNYMNSHPALQKAAAANPASVVNRADRSALERDHAALNKTDEYLSKHPEIKQELKNNPKLIDDPKYLAAHPGLDKELAEHPEIRKEAMAHPYAFKKAAQANGQYNKNKAKSR